MALVISMDGSETRVTPNERLEALKGRNFPTPDNQRPFGDGDLNKVMDRDLYEATEKGDVEKFIDALEKVSESRRLALSLIFDQVTPSGNSLLHVAAISGREDVMELILFHYPDLMTWKNSSEDTPLHVSFQRGKSEATRMLICLRRNSEIIYWKNKDGKSPLYLAVEIGDMETLRLLLEAYARDEAYAAKIQGMSPVFAAPEEEKLDILREIIDRLPKLIDLRGEEGGTPLHFAASVGNAQAVEVLLEKCPHLALQTDKNGSYPIHIACQGGYINIIRDLVETWPNLAEIKNKKDQNILHVAAKTGNNDMVQSLLKEYGKPVIIDELNNSKDVDGNTPQDLASMHNHCEITRPSTEDKRSDLQHVNNHKLTALATGPRSSSPTHDELQGHANSIEAGVQRSRGRDLQSTRDTSSGARDSARLESKKNWIDAQLVVATLVASVTFTAGISLPGGYDDSRSPTRGDPIMLHRPWFQVFIILDALATYSSIVSVLTLLHARSANGWIRKMYFNIAGTSLSLAVTFMTGAFWAFSVLVVRNVLWLYIIFLCFGVFFAFIIVVFAQGLTTWGEEDRQSRHSPGRFTQSTNLG